MNIEELSPGEGDEAVVLDEAQPEEDEPQVADPPSIEGLAGEMGWTPQETWRGDPEKWKPADQFLKTTVDINAGLSTKLKNMETTLERVSRTAERITEQQVAKARQEVMDKRQEAFDSGDNDAFNKAEQELQTLNVPAQSDLPPETKDFIERNASWWHTDSAAQQYAIRLADDVAQLPPSKQFEYVERKMKDIYPEYFPEKTKVKAPALNSPGARQAVKRDVGMASLPKDAQAMFKDYQRKGMTEKEFLDAWKEESDQ